MARKRSCARKDRGGDPAQAQENVGENDGYEYTREGDEREARAGGPSGHRTGPRTASAEAKRRAQYRARMEVGDGNEWEQFVDEAEGEIRFETYEAWLLKKGWVLVRAYPYKNPDGIVLYETRHTSAASVWVSQVVVSTVEEGEEATTLKD